MPASVPGSPGTTHRLHGLGREQPQRLGSGLASDSSRLASECDPDPRVRATHEYSVAVTGVTVTNAHAEFTIEMWLVLGRAGPDAPPLVEEGDFAQGGMFKQHTRGEVVALLCSLDRVLHFCSFTPRQPFSLLPRPLTALLHLCLLFSPLPEFFFRSQPTLFHVFLLPPPSASGATLPPTIALFPSQITLYDVVLPPSPSFSPPFTFAPSSAHYRLYCSHSLATNPSHLSLAAHRSFPPPLPLTIVLQARVEAISLWPGAFAILIRCMGGCGRGMRGVCADCSCLGAACDTQTGRPGAG